ncbi:hypothetical protein OGAPHI_005374 [Ogataea philodendri]|uniref:USP domain-containing protein n=1 Tax=Ogataea philodendri TaxID=1378263 RepID=A0A9P8P1J1_9ASCO|nr:uncharacterized protein OGAPHI_005374 [Ogataea philodendri]KAH3663384.1 hypothetical protein OGAPHI_005374 [Ogataea philodendri]
MKRRQSETNGESKRTRFDTRPDPTLYLDTINRNVLDFDYEKVCSVSLSDTNIYGCLVCNKYFRGRSMDSECFLHSINEDHHVFVSFDTLNFYILPENYQLDEQTASSLKDIRTLINPTYTDLVAVYQDATPKYDLNGRKYIPGFVGLNNFGVNDYANVILQCLAHVEPLRDFLLLNPSKLHKTNLAAKLSLLVRKMYSPNLFKAHISSHELIQYISTLTNKKFSLNHQSEPRDFLVWLLNALDKELTTELQTPLMSSIFQGKLRTQAGKSKFWMITLKLPPVTLFKDGARLEVPQIALEDLIKGTNYNIIKYPQILTLYIHRRDDSKKIAGVHGSNINPTIVKFNPSQLVVGGQKYELLANIVFTAGKDENYSMDESDQTHYKVQIRDSLRDQWLEMNDLKVEPIEKDLLFLNQTYLQVWGKMH